MKKKSLIFLCFFIIFINGCGSSSEETELKHPDKSPEALNEVSSGVDDIGKSIDEIERLVMDIPTMEEEEDDETSESPEAESKQQQSKDNQSSEEKSSSEGNGGGDSASKQTQQSQDSQDSQATPKSEEEIKNKKIEKTWKKIDKKIEEIHGFWNEYEVGGQKKGVTREQLDSFENTLNKLTMSVSKKDISETYNEISQSYLALRPVFELYLDDIMAELTNLKYDTYRVYVMGISDGEEIEFQIFEDNEDLYNKIRHKLDDESKNDLIDRLENSIKSLKKGLKEDSRRVNMIKKNIVLDNIEELQE